MSFKRDVFKFDPAGIVMDLPPDAVSMTDFNGGNNVTFRDGIASRVRGYAPVYGAPLFNPELLANLRTPLTNWWVYAARTGIGATDGASHGNITPAVFAPTTDYNQWSAAWINKALVLNQAKINPVYWEGGLANICKPLPGWPANTKAKVIRASRYHLFALNITDIGGNFDNGVMWSDAAEPGTVPLTWAATPANQAGDLQLSAGGGGIVDGLNMRDTMMIYKNNEVWGAQYVGGNTIFAFRKILGGVGALSQNCIVSYAGFHVVLTENDVVLFDGQQVKSIIDKRNKRFLFSQMDTQSFRSSYLVYNTIQNEVWICYPSTGSPYPNKVMVWCIDSDSWGARDLFAPTVASGVVKKNPTATRTWDNVTNQWDVDPFQWDNSTYTDSKETLLAAVIPKLQNIDLDVTNDGALVQSYLVKTGISLGNPVIKKLIRRVWPRMGGVNGTIVNWRIGSHDAPNDPVNWSASMPFVIGVQETIDAFATGRYLAFEITSNSEQPWFLTGIDVEYSAQGNW